MPVRDTTILYAVRHGETEWNTAGRQQGHLDSALTENGITQARFLAEGLRGRGIEYLYSSDLGRARQTAEFIAAGLGLPVQTDSRLREQHLGCIQGMTQAEFLARFPELSAQLESGDPDRGYPGGESPRQHYERCVACCQELAEQHPGGRLLVVAHGGVLNCLLVHALGKKLLEPRRFSLFNAAINSFQIVNGAWRLDTWGDIAHLKDVGTRDED